MSTQLEWSETPRLVDLLIEEQQTLSAVEDFAAFHDRGGHASGRYESLIPSAAPGANQQYAFRVDLDSCTGCKACVTACHNLNGLEDGEVWRSVGLVEDSIAPGPNQTPDQQTVTTACHHCESPACLAGCPVRAYEKDSVTGIVRHLDDQCIGCRYCQLMCPYDVPKYSERLGIVRKCDMCQGRLAQGEAPACVQGCPNEAISISIVETGSRAEDNMLPVANGMLPDARWTTPTTRYVSQSGVDRNVQPADITDVRPAAAHRPLALMLVLTQAAIGAVCLEGMFSILPAGLGTTELSRALTLSLATILGLAGLGASVLHLGRPQWAFRAVLGLGTSWMSREIVVLGAFAGLLVTAFVAGWADWTTASGPFAPDAGVVASILGGSLAAAAALGLLGLLCSIQIYAVTGRPLWSFERTLLRFGLTVGWGGLAICNLGLVLATLDGSSGGEGLAILMPIALIMLSILKIECESGFLVKGEGPQSIAFQRTRLLLSRELSREQQSRRSRLFLAGCVLPTTQMGIAFGSPGAFIAPVAALVVALLVLAIGLASEFAERDLFFRSEAMPGMPGVG